MPPPAGRAFGRLPRLTAALAAGALASAGAWWLACGQGRFAAELPPLPGAPAPPPTIPVEQPTIAAPTKTPTDGAECVILRTVAGDLVVALHWAEAPTTVRHFLQLVRMGAYDGVHFGGVEPGFYLQVFDGAPDRLFPISNEIEKALTAIPAERTRTRHRRGVLSLPPGAPPDTSAPGFSILLADAPFLDDRQSAFGHIEKGLDVLERLEQVPRYDGDRPTVRLTILQAEVVARDALPGLVLEGARPVAAVLAQEPPPTLAVRAQALLQSRCFRCHGGDKTESGLDLTSQAALFRGGKHGRAVYRGNGVTSPLRSRVAADQSPMPPDGPRLTVAELSLLSNWLDAGAPYPPDSGPTAPDDEGEPNAVSAADAAFWSFAPLGRPKQPPVKKGDWVRTPVDRFILAAIEANGLAPNAEADRRTLIRRLSFDLLGLPPSPAEIDAFVNDRLPDAYENLVDRMLASPHHGERWARHWLDLARYADSGGYEDDDNRPHAYHYRDFVIRAFNDDLPFDTFLRWQIAGDELEPNNPRALAATGFATAGPLQTFFPRKRDRYDELDDVVSTVGTAMLGLTVGCARCHDHKHDPIPTRDYYRLQAVFSGSRREERVLPLAADELRKQQIAERDYFQQETDRLRAALIAKARSRRIDDLPISTNQKALLRRPVAPGDREQAELLAQYGLLLEIEGDEMFGEPDDRRAYERVAGRLAELKHGKPPKALTLSGGLGKAYFLQRGDPERERDAVPPGFLTVLTAGRPAWKKDTWEKWAPPPSQPSPAAGGGQGGGVPQPRRALANWLTDVDGGAGRLAARAIVNRLWQHHFGEGLVRTPSDCGTQGDRPSHPELLDYLAGELIDHGWHLKHVHRLIVNSAAYRQDTAHDAAKVRADPENRWFARRRPQRLEAEVLRDAVLTVSGSLNRDLYGPGVKPPMPAEAIFPTAPKHGVVWPTDAEDGPAVWRRSVYISAKRSNPVPFLQLFDAPDAAAGCAGRSRTTAPTQALILLNDPFVVGQARRFAERVRAAAGEDAEKQVICAFRLALGRPPEAGEIAKAVRFVRGASLAELCQVLFQTNEFAYVD